MSETIEKTFTVISPARLTVNNIRGSVKIAPGEDGVIQVTASKQSNAGDEKRTEIQISQETDGSVKAATRFPDGGWNRIFGARPCQVDYLVKVPRECSIKLNGVSNSVLAEGINGDASVKSVSGEIILRDLTGSILIHTVSGDADGERIAGSLCLETVSGDMTIKESSLTSIKGNSVSGDMQIGTQTGDGPYDFRSVSGDVQLALSPNTHCTAELHSVSGDLVSAFPTTSFSRNHGSQTINIRGGGVKISLHSISGDLSLDCDGEVPPAPVPVKTVTSEERKSVLERVERGELTVAEALGQLHQ